MVVVSILPHAEFGPNDRREDAPHFMIKMSAYKRESKKESMNDHLKIQKPKKNSKKLSLNLSINFTKVGDQKIRLIFNSAIHYFHGIIRFSICVKSKLAKVKS